MLSPLRARWAVQHSIGSRAASLRRITLPFYCGVYCLMGSFAIALTPTLTGPAVSNVGANQVTLTLKSSATGTGYFTLLTGSATPGTGAQTKTGTDGSGAAAFRFGSLPLTAVTDGTYTVRNLIANTAYTICFTADDGTTLQPTVATATFTTTIAATLTGTNWAAVGGVSFTAGAAGELSMAFSPQGAPCFAFRDNASGGKATAMTFNGSTWVGIGAAGFSPDIPNDLTLVFAPDGRPYVGFADFANGNRAKVMRFDGSAWTSVGPANFTAGAVGEVSLAFAPDGAPWVAFREPSNSFKATAMRFDGSTWNVVGSAGFSAGTASDVRLAFSPDGTPYVAYRDAAISSRATVMKFDGSAWSAVGATGFSPGGAYFISLGFAPDGTPHIAYSDYANATKATVMAFASGAWSAVGVQNFSASEAKYLSLSFAPNGRPWVAFRDLVGGEFRASVMAFDGTTWSVIGSRGISADGVTEVPLAFSPDGTPFVLFSDNPTGKATVRKLEAPAASPTVASVGVPAGGTYLPGNPLNFTVNFSAAVDVTGAPRIALTIGSTTRYATYVSGSGTAAIVFRYTVQSGDGGAIALGGSIELNGGTMAGTTGGAAATPTLSGAGSTAGVIVATPPPPPTLTTPTVANLGANQATLTLKSSATGTGYFTLLAGATATPGTGAQTKAGKDSTGAAAARFGSLPLTANTAGTYTVRNLAANTAYTVCFTADDGTTVQPTAVTASFTTSATVDLAGRDWTLVGTAGFTAAGSMMSASLAFSPDGTPYVAYKDYDFSQKVTVRKFNGSAWVVVGTSGFSTAYAEYVSLVFAPDGAPCVVHRENDSYRATVLRFDGSTWASIGTAGFTASTANYLSLAFAPDGTPYVAFTDFFSKATAMKFANPLWSVVGTAGFSGGAAEGTRVEIAPNGVPCVIYHAQTGAATVMKYADIGTTDWNPMGTSGFSAGRVDSTSLAFASDGTPFAAYRDAVNGWKATVMKFDGTNWSAVAAPGFSAGVVNDLSLAIAPDGSPCVGFVDVGIAGKATVMRFNGTNWITLGTRGFSAGAISWTSLAFAPDGVPYVAYADQSIGGKVTVMKLAVPAGPTTPTVAWTAPAAITYGTALSATQLNATASAGSTSVPGTFAYTPAAGTVLEAGTNRTLSVTFTPTDSTTYTTATASTTITVNRAPATVALSGLSAIYDGTAHAATAATTPPGLAVSVTYDGSATVPINAGSYAVAATSTNANYVGSASGTLAIAKAGQTITFAALPARTAGDSAFTLAATATSGLAVSYASSNPSVATISGSTVTIIAAGATTITASQAGNANHHAASDVAQTLTVSATPLLPPPPPPAITAQPVGQQVMEGTTVTFSVAASGSGLNYQWKKDGADIPGAQSSSLTLTSVKPASAGTYRVQVWNIYGLVSSNNATLEVTPLVPPTITRQPVARLVDFGGSALFSITATGTAPLAYQWFKDGAAITAATSATLALTNVQSSAAGTYRVVVTNPAGTVSSNGAALTVRERAIAGVYFGSFGAAPNRGTFALFVRPDGTAVFLGYDCATKVALVDCNVIIDALRRFQFIARPAHGLDPGLGSAADAERAITIDGTISADGAVSGRVSGAFDAALSGPAPAGSQACASMAGFYQAGCAGASAISYAIVSATGEGYVVTIAGTLADAGNGTVTAAGEISVTTENRGSVTGTIDAQTATIGIRLTPAIGSEHSFRGGNNDARTEVERLVNISTRGQVGGGQVLIAGFAIGGAEAKPVLIRAIGPTLGAGFRVNGALSAARLDIFKGSNSIAAGNDWGAAANAAAVASTAAAVGAFPLASNSRDAALVLTLEPGSYTAVVTGQGGASGVALLEVYDATTGAIPRSQRVVNLSARATAGTADNALIAGFVITGTVPKRVLVRGAGPSLAQFPGVGSVLTRPQITVMSGSTTLAQNSGWGTSADAAAISAAASQMGAFPFATNSLDAALLINLSPGAYTVQVAGTGGSGVVLLEVYEIP